MSKAQVTRRRVLLAVALLVAVLFFRALAEPFEAGFTASIFKIKDKDKEKDKEKLKAAEPEPEPEPEPETVNQAEEPAPPRYIFTIVAETPPPGLRRGNPHLGLNVEPATGTWFLGDVETVTITVTNGADVWDSLQLHLYLIESRGPAATLYEDTVTVNPGVTIITASVRVPYAPGGYRLALSVTEEFSGEAYTVTSNHAVTILPLPPILKFILGRTTQ